MIGRSVQCFYDGKRRRGTTGVIVDQSPGEVLVRFITWRRPEGPPQEHWFQEPRKQDRSIHWRRAPSWTASVPDPDGPTLMQLLGADERGDFYTCWLTSTIEKESR